MHKALTQHPEYVVARRTEDECERAVRRNATEENAQRDAHEVARAAARSDRAAGGSPTMLGDYVPADPGYTRELQYALIAARQNVRDTVKRIADDILEDLAVADVDHAAVIDRVVEEVAGVVDAVQELVATAAFVRDAAGMEPLATARVDVAALVSASLEGRSLLDPPPPRATGQVEYIGSFHTPTSPGVIDAANFEGRRPHPNDFRDGRANGGPLAGRR